MQLKVKLYLLALLAGRANKYSGNNVLLEMVKGAITIRSSCGPYIYDTHTKCQIRPIAVNKESTKVPRQIGLYYNIRNNVLQETAKGARTVNHI